MKKLISLIALGTFLATNSLYAGKSIVEAEDEVIMIPEQIDPNPFYIGIGAIWAGVSKDCVCRDTLTRNLKDTTYGGIIRAGYDFNQYFGIEARALKANIETDFAEVTHYGIFLKPMMPVGEQMNIYGLVGYGKTEIIADCEVLYEEFKHDGFSFGIGLEYDLSDRDADKEDGTYERPFDGHGDQEKGWGLWVDYQNLMHDEGPNNYKTNIVSFGITYDF